MDQKDKAMWVHTLWDPLDEIHQSPLNENEKIVKVAAYCRISEGKTNGLSLENQVSYYSNYIYNKPNWKFVGVYMDDQKSGRTIHHRTGFKRMLRHTAEGKIDLILTKNISRFSRNTKELLEVIQELKETGTTLYFESEGLEISNGKNSLLLETHAAMAQDFIENISNLIKFSYQKRLHEGRPYYGDIYGYDPVELSNKSMVKINEEEAEVVRWIFESFINGMSYAEITRQLIYRGVKTKKEKGPWNGNYVRKIIKEIAYTGHKVAMKRQKDLFSNKIKENSPYQERYMITNSHPAIISMEVFEKAQERAAEVKKKHSRPKDPVVNPLKNRIICGRCGNKIRKKGPYVYRCAYSEAFVKLCDLDSIKKQEPLNMGLIAMFKRLMGLDISISKSGNIESLGDHKERSEEEIKRGFEVMLQDLKKILTKVNQNDHFEFHRLKYFSEIEIAKALGDWEKEDAIKKEYKAFEEKISRIEDDRTYRNEALSWLKTIRTIEHFISTAMIEIIRAWVMEIKIYSSTAFCVHWIDEEETVIGEKEINAIIDRVKQNEIDRGERLKEHDGPNFQVEGNINVNLSESINVNFLEGKEEIPLELAFANKSQEIFKIPEKAEVKNQHLLPVKEVVKLERGLTIRDLSNLKKNILKFQVDKLKQEETKKLRVAAYCRVSTHLDEQKLSLQTQLAYYNFKVLSNPQWELVDIYADEGLSGKSTEKRDEFNRMISDVRKGRIDMIITKSVSRFSRNVLDVLETVNMLNELEHKPFCFFEKEGIKTNDPHSSILLSLMAVAAEEELNSLSNSITWGIQNYAKRGIITRVTDIYGYEIDKYRTWHIVEEEAKVVKLIYKRYIEGKMISQIIEELSKMKIQSPKGNSFWSYNTIRSILQSEKYMGDYEYQKSFVDGVIDSKRKINRGDVPSIYIEDHHLPIVDKETFDKAQQIFEERKRELGEDRKDGTAGRSVYYKTFTCSNCGALITRYRSSTYDSKEGSAWRCKESYKKIGSTCEMKTAVIEKFIDYNFLKTLEEIKKSDLFKLKVDKYLKKLALTPKEEEEQKAIKEKMEQLNQELYKAVDTEIQKDGKDTVLINELTSEIISLREKLQYYTKRLEQLDEETEKLNKLLKYSEKMKPISFRTFHHMRPRINPGDSIYSTTNNARDSTYMDQDGEDFFPEEIFKEQVLSGTMAKDGRITYEFATDIKFGIDMAYVDYKRQLEEEKAIIQLEELLGSLEVLKMKEFCKKGKKPKAIREHLGIKSKVSFDKRILKPLYKAGKLTLKRGRNVSDWWYSWSENNHENQMV